MIESVEGIRSEYDSVNLTKPLKIIDHRFSFDIYIN